MSPIWFAILFLAAIGGGFVQNESRVGRSFLIGYNDNCFLKDGECFRYVSGSMHYFRVPRTYWKDRMLKMRAAGLNALQTYIEWNSHESEPGVFDFSGNLDIVEYIKMAQEVGLLVILRAGPFIDAERDMGGLPYWLFRMNKTMKIRTNDPTYMFYVERYYSKLLPLLKPLTYVNGGPIITLHVENEYGSYYACDRDYTARLRLVFEKALGPDVLFCTADGSGDSNILCGQVDGAYTTVDFGTGVNVTSKFSPQRKREPRGPLVNSEFYPGWLDHWGEPHAKVDSSMVIKTLDEMLAMNASVNIYMFHGGTSFGLTAGANVDGSKMSYNPTSYDYDAPISEAGDVTDKFMKIREVVGKYLPLPPGPLPKNSTKISFGPVQLTRLYSVLDILPEIPPFVSNDTLTFEEVGLNQGFIFYETVVATLHPDPVLLSVPGIQDRGYVYVDREFQGIVSRGEEIFSMPLLIRPGQKLAILVENQGRAIATVVINDFKGIVGNVTLGETRLRGWNMWPLNVSSLFHPSLEQRVSGGDDSAALPAVFASNFTLPNGSQPSDTFLSFDGWYKGVVSINNFTLGRYWPIVGPQKTLYVPGSLLKAYPEVNSLLLMELEGAPCPQTGTGCSVYFVDKPDIDSITPASSNSQKPRMYKIQHDWPLNSLHSYNGNTNAV